MSYGLNLTSLEEVFLRIAHDEDVAEAAAEEVAEVEKEDISSDGNLEYKAVPINASSDKAPLLAHYRPNLASTIRGLLVRRLLITKRNIRGLFFQFFFHGDRIFQAFHRGPKTLKLL